MEFRRQTFISLGISSLTNFEEIPPSYLNDTKAENVSGRKISYSGCLNLLSWVSSHFAPFHFIHGAVSAHVASFKETEYQTVEEAA